jgi:hypothetical protein
MQDRDSFYYRAIRTKIGDALRAQYDVKEPLPEPLAKILLEFDSEGVPVVEADRVEAVTGQRVECPAQRSVTPRRAMRRKSVAGQSVGKKRPCGDIGNTLS